MSGSRALPKIVELDFGMGNIRSLQKAFEYFGQPVEVITHPELIVGADALLIPGDGAFGMAMENLKSSGLHEAVCEFVKTGKPVLGICIGFQLLFESTREFDYKGSGLDFLKGKISRFPEEELTVPHMGWNQVKWLQEHPLIAGVPDLSWFYFVHSYRLAGRHPAALGVAEYGGPFTAVVTHENITGLQFHPEKSYLAGLRILENFTEMI